MDGAETKPEPEPKPVCLRHFVYDTIAMKVWMEERGPTSFSFLTYRS